MLNLIWVQNCLQRLSADDTSGQMLKNEFCFSDVEINFVFSDEHESLSILGPVQSKLHQNGIMSILKCQSQQIPSVLSSAEML